MNGLNRRDFIRGAAAIGAGVVVGASALPARGQDVPAAQGKNVAGLALPPMEKIRVGMIGLGARGGSMVGGIASLPWVEIVAICDKVPDKVERTAKRLAKRGKGEPAKFSGSEDAWKKLCELDNVDVVYISTPWELHTPQCLYAMQNGKHAFTEVPAAVTLEECWALVDASEKNQKHCAILENCCYGEEELLVLNMAHQGAFGTLVHGEAAYIHDLRGYHFDPNGYQDMWRLKMCEKYAGNTYPTHGLGPVSLYMDINRGDKYDYMVSMGSLQAGMTEYAIEHFGKDSPQAKQEYKLPDINTSIIKTAKGRTIMVQHDVTSPRPYSRINMLSGTKGIFYGYPDRMTLSPNSHEWFGDKEYNENRNKYRHPLWAKLEKEAKENGGHGGMDFVMLYRLFDCLRKGIPVDLNVYDAASWSCIFPLSIQSAEKRSGSVDIPDFTRGAWKTTGPLKIEV